MDFLQCFSGSISRGLVISAQDPHLPPMIEIYWGKPLNLVVTTEGDIQKFSTIEQAQHWLKKKWPIADEARTHALLQIDAAMSCLGSVKTARRAFISAARSAGFRVETLMT